MKCTDCKYGYQQDTGYSNYTVMGVDFYCLLGAHYGDGFDLWYDQDERLLYANDCSSFYEGDNLFIDVEMESGSIEQYTCDDEIIKLFKDGDF